MASIRFIASTTPHALATRRARSSMPIDWALEAYRFAQRNYRRGFSVDDRLIGQYVAEIVTNRAQMYYAMKKGDRRMTERKRANLDYALSAYRRHAGHSFLGS